MAESTPMAARLMDVYHRFQDAYGPQHWWPGEGPFEVIVGAILTQSAAWTNVEKALAAMRSAGCWSLGAVHRIPEAELAQLVRSSGYFNAKARKLKAFAAHVAVNYTYPGGLDGNLDGELDESLARFFSKPTGPLREELLSIHGIGEETADDIMVYAALKPSFVIDTYTRRIMDRLGMTPGVARPRYADYQAVFHGNLPHDEDRPEDTQLFNEFHALWDRHAKESCTKLTPRCENCCLLDLCPTGQKLIADG